MNSNNKQPILLLDDGFCKILGEFLVQTISGSIVYYIENLKLNPNATRATVAKTLMTISQLYINDCWHSFGKRDDRYVVDTLDNILAYNIIRDPGYLFLMFNNICDSVYNEDIIHQIVCHHPFNGTLLELNTHITMIVSHVLRIVLERNLADIQHYADTQSDNICDHKYDGRDFFTFTNLGSSNPQDTQNTQNSQDTQNVQNMQSA
jgi:hypothetical protein